MRKIVACEFVTLDGVIQSESVDGDGFQYSGWFFGYADEVTGEAIQERLSKQVDLLLGRKTFAAWESYWPTHSHFWPNVMTATKYVASNSRTTSEWQPTVFLGGDLANQVQQLKQSDGPDLHVMGSGEMLQTLFQYDLVDELHLMIFPITLGTGGRLFTDGTIPAAFKLRDSRVSPNGILIVNYERAGDIKTGSPQIEEN